MTGPFAMAAPVVLKKHFEVEKLIVKLGLIAKVGLTYNSVRLMGWDTVGLAAVASGAMEKCLLTLIQAVLALIFYSNIRFLLRAHRSLHGHR